MRRDRVDDLVGRHDDVDHLEVLLQPVADEAAAGVDQLAQLQVGRLHRGDVVARDRRVEVARVQPRVAGQVVDHRLGLCSAHMQVCMRRACMQVCVQVCVQVQLHMQGGEGRTCNNKCSLCNSNHTWNEMC